MEHKTGGKKENCVDQQYCDLLEDIRDNGRIKDDRTGTGTKSVFGRQLRFDLSRGEFPLLTSKGVYTKGVIVELLWFLGKHKGEERYEHLSSTNIRYLLDNRCNIWVGDIYKKYIVSCDRRKVEPYTKQEFIDAIKTSKTFAGMYGDLGPVYGEQWTNWSGAVNQIDELIGKLKTDPDSRRLIVNAWNVAELDKMVLPPCHYNFQCYTDIMTVEERCEVAPVEVRTFLTAMFDRFTVSEVERILDMSGIPTRRLSLIWSQRSADVPIGIPFNIASYGFLLCMLADLTNMSRGNLIGHLGDCHIYVDQFRGVEHQLNNTTFPLPKLTIKPGQREKLTDYNIEDFVIEDYKNAGVIVYPLSN